MQTGTGTALQGRLGGSPHTHTHFFAKYNFKVMGIFWIAPPHTHFFAKYDFKVMGILWNFHFSKENYIYHCLCYVSKIKEIFFVKIILAHLLQNLSNICPECACKEWLWTIDPIKEVSFCFTIKAAKSFVVSYRKE